jgi:transcriptional regulator with XRE-family HTH domain
MNETTNPTAIVTGEYRKRLGMTYRAFSEALNEHLVNTSITHASVMNWEKGMTDPATDFLLSCLVVYDLGDWRTQFAIDALVAKLPAVFDRDEERKLLVLSTAASHAKYGESMVARAV